MPPALAQIKDILAYGQSKLITKEEMSALITALTKFIKSYKEAQIKEIQELRVSVETERADMQKMMGLHKKQMEKSHNDMIKRMSEMRGEMLALVPLPTDLSHIENQLAVLAARPAPEIPTVPTMDEMKMHALMGLSIADIAGLDERLKQLDRMARGGGGRLLGGVLNVGMRVETPEGTVDGSNVTFTAFKEPKRVVGDGAVYYAGQGYTYSGKTITMSVAPAKFIRSEY